jgi:hypothetical protein
MQIPSGQRSDSAGTSPRVTPMTDPSHRPHEVLDQFGRLCPDAWERVGESRT